MPTPRYVKWETIRWKGCMLETEEEMCGKVVKTKICSNALRHANYEICKERPDEGIEAQNNRGRMLLEGFLDYEFCSWISSQKNLSISPRRATFRSLRPRD